jgi:hypothetical protein
VRSVIFGLFLGLMTVFNASADVMYSYYEPDPPPEFGLTPNISFEFTEPSLLTTLTVVPGSSIKSISMFDGGRSVSILSVTIDPGMNNGSYWIAPGVPYLGIVMGIDGQYAMSEGMCFVPDHYGCTASPNADVMDHFGTYTIVDSSLTISSVDTAPAAVPEPRFETATGLAVLLLALAYFAKLGTAAQTLIHAFVRTNQSFSAEFRNNSKSENPFPDHAPNGE